MQESLSAAQIKRAQTNGLNPNKFRAVGRSENPGVPVLFGGNNLTLLFEIGLTDLPKSGVPHAMAPPVPPGMTPLLYCLVQS